MLESVCTARVIVKLPSVISLMQWFHTIAFCTLCECYGSGKIWQLNEHKAIVPHALGVPQGLNTSYAAICGNMTVCLAHVRGIAPWDFKLYDYVSSRFATRLQREGLNLKHLLMNQRHPHAQSKGVCKPTHRLHCCCTQRNDCFNFSGRAKKWLAPPPCVPGPTMLHKTLSYEMHGRCCTQTHVAHH